MKMIGYLTLGYLLVCVECIVLLMIEEATGKKCVILRMIYLIISAPVRYVKSRKSIDKKTLKAWFALNSDDETDDDDD